MGTSLRTLFGLYFLNFVDFKNLISKNNFLILVIFLFTFFFVIISFSLDNFFLSLFEFVNQRNVSDMGGREYDEIPNFSENGYWGVLLRSIIWPALFLSGSFVFFSENIFKLLGIEILLYNF